MSIIQLDMFSPLYYSTLGYDEELIDYLSFIEDQQIRNFAPLLSMLKYQIAIC
jgi:hypothetical protein